VVPKSLRKMVFIVVYNVTNVMFVGSNSYPANCHHKSCGKPIPKVNKLMLNYPGNTVIQLELFNAKSIRLRLAK